MQKQWLTSLLCVLFSSTVLATTGPFNGFYVNGGVGGENIQVKDENRASLNSVVDFNVPFSPTLTDNSAILGVGIGFSNVFKQFLLVGLEGRANSEDVEVALLNKFTTSTPSVTITSDNTLNLLDDFSLLVKLGLLLQPKTLIYGLVGPTWGYFKASTRANGNIFQIAGSGINIDDDHYQTGWLAGLGLEYLMTKQLSLAFEYTHADYGAFDSLKASKPIFLEGSPIGTLSLNNEFNVKTDSVVLRLTYYFNKNEVKYKN